MSYGWGVAKLEKGTLPTLPAFSPCEPGFPVLGSFVGTSLAVKLNHGTNG